MPHVDLRIVRLGDPPPLPADTDAIAVPAEATWTVIALEGGMTSGKPSIALRLPLPDGRAVLAQTSLQAWIAVTCALRAAFPDVFAGTPLE